MKIQTINFKFNLKVYFFNLKESEYKTEKYIQFINSNKTVTIFQAETQVNPFDDQHVEKAAGPHEAW